jgi:ribosomal protein S18 acetylase RimI-like enzyme
MPSRRSLILSLICASVLWGILLLVVRYETRTMLRYSDEARPSMENVVGLYRSVGWSSADKPGALHAGLVGCHYLVTAWDGELLVGLGNAISDGDLVVYFPHLLVCPEYQGRGIGNELMRRMMKKYHGFHQQVLLADGRGVDFYKKLGFSRASSMEPLWIFHGHEHD